MKKFIGINILLVITIGLKAQNLSEIYKSEKINLVEVEDFAEGNDWNKIFYDYDYKINSRPVGLMRYIEVKDNGLIFLTGKSVDYTLKFDQEGRLITNFSKENTNPSVHELSYFRSSKDDKFLVYGNYRTGEIRFLDLDGKFIKKHNVDYGVRNYFPLNDGKYAHDAFVVWGGDKSRRICVISDIDNQEDKIVFSHFSEKFGQTIKIKMGKGMGSISLPYRDDLISRRTADGNLLVALNNNDEIKIISHQAESIKTINLGFIPREFSQKDREEFKEQVNSAVFGGTDIDGTQKMFKPSAEEMKKLDDPKFYPKHLPFFYDLRVDSDNNLLVFIYTESETNPTFRAYSIDTGEFLGQATLNSEKYEIKTNQIDFHDGYLYGVLPLKDAKGNPLRLVKFKLEPGN